MKEEDEAQNIVHKVKIQLIKKRSKGFNYQT